MRQDNTQRFGTRAADYARYRPGYPPALIEYLRSDYGLADHSVVAEVARPGPRDLEDALVSAERGFDRIRAMSVWERADALLEVSRRLGRDRDAFARTISLEGGKPITQARAEVDRAVHTFRISAEEARRLAKGRTQDMQRVIRLSDGCDV